MNKEPRTKLQPLAFPVFAVLVLLCGLVWIGCNPAAGSGGDGGTGATGGAGATGGSGSNACVLDQECDPQDFENPTFCDGPCRTFCQTSGTDAYGVCGENMGPSQTDTYYCVCHCFAEPCF